MMITIIFGLIVTILCLIGVLQSKNPFDGILFGPGMLMGVAILIVGLIDYFLL